MPYELKGRRVLVTGGSRGLGALICEKFAIEGACIMVNYVSNKEKAEQVARKVETYGVKAYIVQGVRFSFSKFFSYSH
jgi:NAD(P)-dependent dehydrogenase (short-subunit alcohol dehydrogenase family)